MFNLLFKKKSKPIHYQKNLFNSVFIDGLPNKAPNKSWIQDLKKYKEKLNA